MRIYMRHARSVIGTHGRGLCSRGMRAFAKRHNLNYLDFARNGIDVEELKHIEDAFINRIIKLAEAEYSG